MSLQSKIEAVIYASEEPVTLQQLVGLLAVEAGAEVERIANDQASLPLVTLEGTAEQETEKREPGPAELAPEPGTANGAELTGDPAQDAVASDDPAVSGPEAPTEGDRRAAWERERAVREHIRRTVEELIREYAQSDRGIEIREVASGYRMGTRPEYHDAVRGFVKSLKPALRLTLQALETLAVVAYKQPVTAAEISEIRGVDSAGVLGGLLARKLVATAGRKQVIGRPMLYKTTRDFLLRFGLKDVQELPSMEEFERMAGELAEQEDLPMESTDALVEQANARGDAEHILDANGTGDALTSGVPGPHASNPTEQNATAESAAGGNDEEPDTDTVRPAQAEAVQPTEAGANPSSEESR